MTISATPMLSVSSLWGVSRWERVCAALPAGRLVLLPGGREALYLALEALGVGAGDRVMLPAYLCPAVVAPVVRLGAHPAFYPVRADLTVDFDVVQQALGEDRPRAMVLVHFFGLPDPRLRDLLDLAGSRDVPLIEDCAHALFGTWNALPLGSFGRASVFSLKKTLPSPGGGILRLADGVAEGRAFPVSARAEVGSFLKLVGYAMEARLPLSVRGRLLASPRVRRGATRRDEVRPVSSQHGLGPISRRVLIRSDPEAIAARRRANFVHALERLREKSIPGIRPLVSSLPEGACPLGLPLAVEGDREGLRTRLYRRGLLLPAMWDRLPDLVPLERFPDARYLRDHILVLPVNHDLGPTQIDRAVEALEQWSRR